MSHMVSLVAREAIEGFICRAALVQAAKEELEQRQRADAKLRKEASRSAGA